MLNHFEVPYQLYFLCIRKTLTALLKTQSQYAFCHKPVKPQMCDEFPQPELPDPGPTERSEERKREWNMQIKGNVLPKTGAG